MQIKQNWKYWSARLLEIELSMKKMTLKVSYFLFIYLKRIETITTKAVINSQLSNLSSNTNTFHPSSDFSVFSNESMAPPKRKNLPTARQQNNNSTISSNNISHLAPPSSLPFLYKQRDMVSSSSKASTPSTSTCKGNPADPAITTDDEVS